MTNTNPQLAEAQQPWYRGLTRYHWWVMIMAIMGWMFCTMSQHFFTLGRGPAMQQILNNDPVVPGLELLGEKPLRHYTAADLDVLVGAGRLSPEEKVELLTGPRGVTKASASRKEVATVIGRHVLWPAWVERGEKQLTDEQITAESFSPAELGILVDKKVLSQEIAKRHLEKYPDGVISRADLAAYVGQELAKARADTAGDNATFIFVMGWALGGLIFGWVGDSLGRAKTMGLTIVIYAFFTALNGLAQTELQFNVFRFLAALGVGGEFAAGAALVAETMPDRSRPAALGAMQAMSAGGNMLAAVLGMLVLPLLGWRWLFAFGAFPLLVALLVFLKLHEPEKWREARRKWLAERAAGTTKKLASYGGIIQDARWRHRAIIALLLGVVGVGGLWGVGFFTPELNRMIARDYSPERAEAFVSQAFFLQQVGSFFGISAYTILSLRMGRRPAFAFFFVIAFIVVSYTFLFADTIWEAYLLAPLVGFVTLGPFGGYAIYFPELFPTRLRSTGTGLGYNVGRFLAALVPSFKAKIKEMFMAGTLVLPLLPPAFGNAERAIRYGSFLMIFIYIVGLIVLIWAPETKGQPLPED